MCCVFLGFVVLFLFCVVPFTAMAFAECVFVCVDIWMCVCICVCALFVCIVCVRMCVCVWIRVMSGSVCSPLPVSDVNKHKHANTSG